MNTKSRTSLHSTPSTSRYDEKDAFSRLAKACEGNDEKAILEIRNEIMLANGGLLRVLARKACRYHACLGLTTPADASGLSVPVISEEDFLQHGYILMYKAIETFKPSKGNRFSTYATIVVGHGLNQVYNTRAVKKYACRRFVSLDTAVGDEGEATLGDFIADDRSAPVSTALEGQDLRHVLAAALATLGERERAMVAMSQGYGCRRMKLVEIAKLFQVTPQRVTQIVKAAIRKLQEHPAIRELRRAG